MPFFISNKNCSTIEVNFQEKSWILFIGIWTAFEQQIWMKYSAVRGSFWDSNSGAVEHSEGPFSDKKLALGVAQERIVAGVQWVRWMGWLSLFLRVGSMSRSRRVYIYICMRRPWPPKGKPCDIPAPSTRFLTIFAPFGTWLERNIPLSRIYIYIFGGVCMYISVTVGRPLHVWRPFRRAHSNLLARVRIFI